jgi:Na+/H+ antiporter NhaD/arsenite permease-like protein
MFRINTNKIPFLVAGSAINDKQSAAFPTKNAPSLIVWDSHGVSFERGTRTFICWSTTKKSMETVMFHITTNKIPFLVDGSTHNDKQRTF